VPGIERETDPLLFPADGVGALTVGAAVTVRHPAHVAGPPSGFVIVSVRAPVAAPDVTVTLRVNWVAPLRVTELTVTPVPDTSTVGVPENPVPSISTDWLVAP